MAYEKMSCHYESERDLIDRLHNTICRYDGKALYVAVQSKNLISLHDPVTIAEVMRIKPNDPLFDISSPELGYMNSVGRKDQKLEVRYVQRNPVRRYRQGLCPESCSSYQINGSYIGGLTNDVFRQKALVDMIEGNYPPFKLALEMLLSGGAETVAISRDIALQYCKTGLILVYCSCENIGYILPDETGIRYKDTATSWVYDLMLKKAGLRTERNSKWL